MSDPSLAQRTRRVHLIDGDEPALWHVTIERTDENASMTAIQVDPEVALEELVRYTRGDAR